MRFVTSGYRLIVLLFVTVLSACSGGNQQSSTNTSTNSVNFSAASPDALTPPSQTFTATVSAGTVYVAILHTGAAIAKVTSSLSGTTAQIVVDPPSPGSLGSGAFIRRDKPNYGRNLIRDIHDLGITRGQSGAIRIRAAITGNGNCTCECA